MKKIPFDRVFFISTTIEEIQKSIQKIKSGSLKSIGLRSSDLMCLWALGKHPDGLTATELSHECCVDKALISRAIKKLASIGAVFYEKPTQYKDDGSDSEEPSLRSHSHPYAHSHRKRNYRIRLKLTGSGGEMSEQLGTVVRDVADSAKIGIEGNELDQLCKILTRLNQNLKEYVKQEKKSHKTVLAVSKS